MNQASGPVANTSDFLTLRGVARELGVRTHRVRYATDEFGIEPAGRVGIARVWHRNQLPAFRAVLNRIAGQRQGEALVGAA